MSDDWRLQIDFDGAMRAQSLAERLGAPGLKHELNDAFHDRTIVTRDDGQVFLYAGTREQAERARELILSIAAQQGWSVDLDLKRWHPTAEDWEDPDKPLRSGGAGQETEHEAMIAAERRETEERDYPEFEVRVDLPSRHGATHLAERLRSEGVPTVHRWKFLLVGATDEDSAKALAERIRNEAPSGSRVKVEGTWRAAYDERPRNPFAVLGGLGG